MREASESVLNFLHVMEQLKNEPRHSWTSKGRRESVAEHSWRLSLMVLLCAPYVRRNIDLLKALKLAILHDIGEARIGDQHYLDTFNQKTAATARSRVELEAVHELSLLLGCEGNTIASLWKEFEERLSEESKFVYFLDKLEACIQHNEAGLESWSEQEKSMITDYYGMLSHEDEFLTELKASIQSETSEMFRKGAVSDST